MEEEDTKDRLRKQYLEKVLTHDLEPEEDEEDKKKKEKEEKEK